MGVCANCEPVLGPASVRREADQVRLRLRARLEADPTLEIRCAEHLGWLRDFAFAAARGRERNPKDLARRLEPLPLEIRETLALRGAEQGCAGAILKHLSLFGLGEQAACEAALLCAAVDPAQALACLEDAPFRETGQRLVVALAALGRQPRFDFEAFKGLETQYLAAEGDAQIQHRYEQACNQRSLQARRHLLAQVPDSLLRRPDCRFALLRASLSADPCGTLDYLGERGQGEPCEGLSPEQRLDLLHLVASEGCGFASGHLGLFGVPEGPAWERQLQAVFQEDLIAGSTILGVCALEGAHRYPFGLERIELVLPRRITSVEALRHLKRGEHPEAPARTFSALEVGEAAALMQEREMTRFLEVLKSDLARGWRRRMGPLKQEIVFGDLGLRIRDILFLLAHALFEEEARFERIHRFVQRNHPLRAGQRAHMVLLANRFFFMEVLGLQPGPLFARGRGGKSAIEGAGDFQIRTFLHLGMSIHLRVGSYLFCNTFIAWSSLLDAFDGDLDAVFQDLSGLLEGVDNLLTLIAPLSGSLEAWVDPLLDALQEEAPEMPDPDRMDSRGAFLNLESRRDLQRHRETLNRYCVQALAWRAGREGVSPGAVLQGLRLPRVRADRLRVVLDASRAEAAAQSKVGSPSRARIPR